jgi:hypothetical protein
MTPASRSRSLVPLINRVGFTTGSADPVIQVVVLHGNIAPDGHLGEIEILASTDSSLNQTALDRAHLFMGIGRGNPSQPGVTPQSHEALFTFEFVTSR